MHIKLLGARQGEATDLHFVTLLLDERIALDAGNLTASLTLREQMAVQDILITHRHYDHIKDLASFGFNILGRGQATIHCTSEVKKAIGETILNPDIWLDFFNLPTADAPAFRHHSVEHNRSFEIGGFQIRPVAMRHSVPATGYAIVGPNGRVLLYTGDNGPGCGKDWIAMKPDLIVTEVTHGNADTELAVRYRHLSPRLLEAELEAYGAANGGVPRLAIVHMSPYQEPSIIAELAALARRLGADISVPREGETIEM